MNKQALSRKKRAAAPPRMPPALYGLCLSALVAAVAAFFVTANITDSGLFLFVPDAANVYRPYLDVARFGFGLDGWRTPVAPFYFPDFVLFFALSFIFPALWLMPSYFFIIVSIGASGWMMVCREVGGGAKTQAMVWLIHALQLALLSYPGNDLFAGMTHPLWHGGLWAIMPWLVWGALDRRRWIILFVLLAATGASDLLVVAWFVLPALLAHGVAVWFGKSTLTEWGRAAAIGIGGVALGRALSALIPLAQSANTGKFLRVDWATLPANIIGIARNLGYMAGEYPILTLIWLMFLALLVRCVFRDILSCARQRKSAAEFKPLFVLAFFPAAMASPIIAQALAGLETTHTEEYGLPFYDFVLRMRYVLPFVLLPLFVGWCFLPLFWRGRWPVATKGDIRIVAALAAGVVCVAAPRIALAFANGHSVSPFNAPFSACVRDAAKRLGWVGAIGPYTFWGRSVIDPDNPIKQNLVVEQTGHPDAPLFTAWDFTNRHWHSGEFQAVIINDYDGKLFFAAPRDAGDACKTEACLRLHPSRTITHEVARATFGEPAEVVVCEGIPIYHYDPPIRVDMSERSDVSDYPVLHHRHDL